MSDGPVEIPQGLENDGPPSHEEYIPPAPIQESTEQTQEVSSNEEGGDNSGTGNTGGNPAWSPLLEKVPAPFHNEIKPFLSEWDKNFEKVQSQYAPYKSIIEQGVKPEDINNSLQLAQLINANPRLVFDQLAARFGFNSGQGHEEDNAEDEDNPEDEENNLSNPMENPALRPYIERQQQMEQYLEQQAQIAQQQRVDQEIQQEWSSIEKAHGSPIPQDIKTEMIQRAIWIADQKGPDAVPSIKEGYDSYNEFVNRVRGQKANNTAPQVFGGNGGLPSTPAGIHAGMSDEERKDYIAKRAEQLAKQNQD